MLIRWCSCYGVCLSQLSLPIWSTSISPLYAYAFLLVHYYSHHLMGSILDSINVEIHCDMRPETWKYSKVFSPLISSVTSFQSYSFSMKVSWPSRNTTAKVNQPCWVHKDIFWILLQYSTQILHRIWGVVHLHHNAWQREDHAAG